MNKKKGLRRFLTLDVHNHEGFTLVELIVVIAILGILAGVAVPTYSGYVKKANRAADEVLLSEINTAFQAACIENYTDASAITSAEWDKANMTVKSVQGDAAHPIVASFGRYFDTTSEFKVIQGLYFDGSLHRFVEQTSSFQGEGVIGVMGQTLTGISAYFSASEAMVNTLRDSLLKNTSATLSSDVLGFDQMFSDLNAAMSETEIEAYLREKGIPEDQWTTELKAAVKGNLGILHFAGSAGDHTAQDVMNSVNVVAAVLGASGYECTQAEFETTYLQNLTADEQAYYNNNVRGKGDAAYENFLETQASNGGDFKASYGTLIQMEKAAEALKAQNMSNTTGISTLGAMYALAAGYFNSDYYANEENPSARPNSYGDFDSVTLAMSNESFMAYYAEQGTADLEYYLNYMASLDKNNIDLTDPNAFAGLSGQG